MNGLFHWRVRPVSGFVLHEVMVYLIILGILAPAVELAFAHALRPPASQRQVLYSELQDRLSQRLRMTAHWSLVNGRLLLDDDELTSTDRGVYVGDERVIGGATASWQRLADGWLRIELTAASLPPRIIDLAPSLERPNAVELP